MKGLCTLCGNFGQVVGHHISQGETLVVCSSCHRRIHEGTVLRGTLGKKQETVEGIQLGVPQKKPLNLPFPTETEEDRKKVAIGIASSHLASEAKKLRKKTEKALEKCGIVEAKRSP